MTRALLIVTALTLFGAAQAHADLETSSPIAGEVLAELPEAVTLSFTEPVEVRFSTFKVYPLEAEIDMSEENAAQRLNGLAGRLVSDVLEARGDEEARADTAAEADGRSSTEITLPLKGEVDVIHYVVMWRVLSIDTHTTKGFFTFSVESAP